MHNKHDGNSENQNLAGLPSDSVQIISLPLNKADRAEFIKAANSAFETVMDRMEPDNPEATRKLWSAEHYVDNVFSKKIPLPISRDFALYWIDASLVHHVLSLALQADKQVDKER